MPHNRFRLEKYSQLDNRAKPETPCNESNAYWKISKCEEKKVVFLIRLLHMLVLELWIVLMHIKAL